MLIEQPNIAVYGGSFDPIHNAHIQIINEILNLKVNNYCINFDTKTSESSNFFTEVIVVPTYRNPFKANTLFTFNQRVDMLKTSFKNILDSNSQYENSIIKPTTKLVISELEQSLPVPSFTYSLLQSLKDLYPSHKIFLIIGSDLLQSINQWYMIKTILKQVNLIVVSRDNARVLDFDINQDKQDSLIQIINTRLISWGEFGKMDKKSIGQIIHLPTTDPIVSVSSSQIKTALIKLIDKIKLYRHGLSISSNNIDLVLENQLMQDLDTEPSMAIIKNNIPKQTLKLMISLLILNQTKNNQCQKLT